MGSSMARHRDGTRSAIDRGIAGGQAPVTIAVFWIPALLDALLIFFLSSRPRPEDDLPPGSILELLYESTPGADKVTHFLSFFIFAALCSLAFNASRPARTPSAVRDNAILVALVAIVYAASDEVHQHFVPPRAPDLADFLADCLGALFGTAVLAWLALRKMRAARAHGELPQAR